MTEQIVEKSLKLASIDQAIIDDVRMILLEALDPIHTREKVIGMVRDALAVLDEDETEDSELPVTATGNRKKRQSTAHPNSKAASTVEPKHKYVT